MKLLCIEDDPALVKSLRRFFGTNSRITSATSGQSGLELAASDNYDAIILDLGLPDMSGIEVCATIREANATVPILVLSGSAEQDTKITLLESGADDYMTKPFNMAELRARLFALLRRSHFGSASPEVYLLTLGDLTLDPLCRRVERSGRSIELRRKEFDILEYLMRNPDKVMTRSMIMENVWESGSDSWDSTINVHIKNLRDRIDRPFKHKLIKTTYGLGYTISERV
jgi:two-component system OmpR family response regulator